LSSGLSSPASLPPGWAFPRLAEIALVNPPPERSIAADNVNVNFVPMRAVEPEGGGLLRPEVRAYGEVKKGYTSFLSGDVIMAKITPCMENGKVTVVPDLPGSLCFGSTEFHVFRAEEGIEPTWIARFLLQGDFRGAAQRAMTGGVGQMRVPAEFLGTVRIPLAPSSEQRRIADALDELFSDLDAAVTALERTRAKLAQYRASVLKAAVEGALTSAWRRQNPRTEPAPELLKRILAERRRRWEERQLRKFKEKGQKPPDNWKTKYNEPIALDTANLPSLPEDWCWSSLGECFEVHVGATPSRAAPEYWSGVIPWVASGEVQFCRIRDTREKITELGLANTSTQLNPRGSVILNMIGEGKTRGKAGLLEIAACNNQNCAAIWVSLTPVPPLYVYYWLVYQYEENRQLGSGNNQPAMNSAIVQRIPIPLPPLDEQVYIVDVIEDQLSIIEHLEGELDAKLHSTCALRQSILRHAFTGQLVPQDPNDEPASGLLTRIAEERAKGAHSSDARWPRNKKAKES